MVPGSGAGGLLLPVRLRPHPKMASGMALLKRSTLRLMRRQRPGSMGTAPRGEGGRQGGEGEEGKEEKGEAGRGASVQEESRKTRAEGLTNTRQRQCIKTLLF